MQAPVPVQSPVQATKKSLAEAGVGVSVTGVPALKVNWQVPPQLMPGGVLVTVPVPDPDFVTESRKVASENVAVTERAADMLTTQAPVPEQSPLQPVKAEPAFGLGVRVTFCPSLKSNEQVAPQLIPAGALVTTPVPVPAVSTDKLKVTASNVATTARRTSMVTTQVPVPEQAPLHPANVDPAAGVGVKVTTVPVANG
jgi:hypothetical protein